MDELNASDIFDDIYVDVELDDFHDVEQEEDGKIYVPIVLKGAINLPAIWWEEYWTDEDGYCGTSIEEPDTISYDVVEAYLKYDNVKAFTDLYKKKIDKLELPSFYITDLQEDDQDFEFNYRNGEREAYSIERDEDDNSGRWVEGKLEAEGSWYCTAEIKPK